MNKYKSLSLADIIFEKLEDDILSGRYPYGEILTEVRLSEELGVSRTPIREALRRLEQEDLIGDHGGRGMFVKGITQKDIADIYDIRLRLEGLAARYAAALAPDEEREKLTRIVELQEFYTEKKDAEQIKIMDSDFHHWLYAQSGSSVLCSTLSLLHKKVQKYRKTSVSNIFRAHASLREHRLILEAIAARDPEAAEERTVAHIRNAKENILKGGEKNWD